MSQWYVARVRPHKEKVAKVNLDNQGIITFLPVFWKTSRRLKAFKDQLHPLFPGYIFFKSAGDAAIFRSVGGTRGVSNVLLGDGRKPQAVPSAFMDDLFDRCVDGVMQQAINAYNVGEAVQITRGPFSGLLGTVAKLSDSGRVALFLEVMGGTVANLTVSDIGPAE